MARRTLLTNCWLLDPEAVRERRGALLIEGERIAGVLGVGEPEPEDAERIDLERRALAPGFIDLHHHGSLVFSEAGDTGASVARCAASMLRHGTTAFLPTTVAWPAKPLRQRVKELANCVMTHDAEGAVPLGIHLEGPWIRPEAAGAQPDAGIRPYLEDEGEALFETAGEALRLVTLAPEAPGADALLRALARRGIRAALGHSLAGAEELERGVGEGICHVTHLFNAMGPLHHRDLGVAGFALADDRLSCDLIADGVHVHPRIVRLAARAKGEGLMLITDRMALPEPGHAADTGYGAGAVRDAGDAFRLADGTLAASNLQLDRALQNALDWGTMTRLEAVAACTLRPARLLGVEAERGSLRPGARADLAVLGAGEQVEQTWLAGRRVI